VVIGNVTLVAPAGTVTVPDTDAIAGLALDRLIANGGDALPVMVIVPVDPAEPVTVAGLTVNFESAGGVTVRTALWLVLLSDAEIVVCSLSATVVAAVMVKFLLVAPDAIVTEEGTVAADVLPLVSVTFSPAAGASLEIVTVPVVVPPCTIVDCKSVTLTTVGGGGLTVSVAD
jgi:hypothetical protein